MESVSKKQTFKIYYGEADIRRFTISPVTWENFQKQLTVPQGQKLVYIDEDNDRCTLSTEKEFDAMMEVFSFENVIKIFFDKNSSSGSSDIPKPEGAGIGKYRIVVPGFVGLSNSVPTCVSPYVSVTNSNASTNIDVDYSALIQEVQTQAAKTPQELKKATDYIHSLFEPSNLESMCEKLRGQAVTVGNALESFMIELHKQFDENRRQIIQQKLQQSERPVPQPQELVKGCPEAVPVVEPKVEVKEQPKVEIKEEPKEGMKKLRFAEVEKPYIYASQLQELMLMGFPEAKAKEALDNFHGDTEFAIDDLLNSEFHHL